MHHLTLPARSTMRFTATARRLAGLHKWSMQVFDAGDVSNGSLARLTYGSQIGERDCDQRIDVPAQDRECRVEVSCRHAVDQAWEDDVGSVEQDTPTLLVIGFCDPASSTAQADDVVLSFAFPQARPA